MTRVTPILAIAAITAAAATGGFVRAAAPARYGAPAATSSRQPPPVSQPPQAASADAPDVRAHQELLDRYCVMCHNQRARTGGLALDTRSLSAVGADAEVWEKVVVKLRAGLMPPVGRLRPARASLDGFTE